MKSTFVTIALFYQLIISTPLSAQSWKWGAGSSVVYGYCLGWSVGVDQSGNVYGSGFTRTLGISSDALGSTYGPYTVVDSYSVGVQSVLVSTDSNGNYRWALGTQAGNVTFYNAATDIYGNTYILGVDSSSYFTFGSRSYSGSGIFCTKVSSSGNVLWIKSIISNTYHFGVGLNGMTVNSTGNVYISGEFQNSSITIGSTTLTNSDPSGTTNDVFFAKFDSSGNPIWARSFGGSANDNSNAHVLTSDSEIYVSGTFSSPSMTIGTATLTYTAGNGGNFYLAKFDASGNPIWAKTISTNDSLDGINGMACDPDGNVYLAGLYWHTFAIGTYTLPVPAYSNAFIAKYDSSGNVKWAQAFNKMVQSWALAADACGNVWLCGGGQTAPDPPAVLDTLFLAEYDTTGVLENTLKVSSGGYGVSGITVDNKGNLYTCGDYIANFPVVVGHDTLTLSDSTEQALFLVKYNYDSLGVCMHDTSNLQVQPIASAAATGLTIFPNPATSELNIESGTAINQITITNLIGKTVYSQSPGSKELQVNIAYLAPGIYFVKVNGTEVKRFVKQ